MHLCIIWKKKKNKKTFDNTLGNPITVYHTRMGRCEHKNVLRGFFIHFLKPNAQVLLRRINSLKNNRISAPMNICTDKIVRSTNKTLPPNFAKYKFWISRFSHFFIDPTQYRYLWFLAYLKAHPLSIAWLSLSSDRHAIVPSPKHWPKHEWNVNCRWNFQPLFLFKSWISKFGVKFDNVAYFNIIK